MIIRQTVVTGVVVALALTSSLALAQQTPKKQPPQQQKGEEAKPDHGTDSRARVAPKSTTIAGKTVTNEDEDLDVRVGKTQTTAAETTVRRDAVESRIEERREVEGRRLTMAPLVGYGFNDLGVGVGARIGYTFATPVYVGGSFMYHAGSEGFVNRPGVTESSSHFMYPGVEVGYDIGVGPVLVRPYVGGGVLFGRMRTVANGVSSTDTEKALMVYPGATAHYIIGKSPAFVGADTRLLLPFENQGVSLTLLGTAGLHL